MNTPIRTGFGGWLAAAASLCVAAVSFGQTTVAHYTFFTDMSNTASSTLASASVIALPTGGTRSTTSPGTGLDGQLGSFAKTNASNAIAEGLAGAITANQYLSFTITPTESLNIQSLGFDFSVNNNTTSVDPYTGSWGVFSSLTGFASGNILATGSISAAKSTGLNASWTSSSVDLQGVTALQGTTTSPIEFRLYFWDNSTTSTSSLAIRFDDIELAASAAAPAVPEPSTYAIFAGGVALCLVVMRRRRAAAFAN